jgi:FMN phosphatase YigB (HAD superfamily)
MLGCGEVAETKSGPGLTGAANSRLVAVADRNPGRAESFARRHGVARWHDDAEAIIAAPDIDAVYVATMTESHRDFVLRCAAAGKPVLTEKPMAMDYAGALEMIAACRRAGVPMGILSNTCAPHWDFLVSSGYAILPGGFREIVLSHEERSAKPDRAIYDVATARAGVPPERIFFCDDLAPHIDTARAVGWDAELFVSAHQLADQLARRGLRLGV